MVYRNGLKPACLPKKFIGYPLNSLRTKPTIIGWGKTSESEIKNQESYLKNSVASRILRKVKIPITTKESPAYENCKSIDTKLQFCAGGIKGSFLIKTNYFICTILIL